MTSNQLAQPPNPDESSPQDTPAETKHRPGTTSPRPYSKGGLIAAWVMTALCAATTVMMVVNSSSDPALAPTVSTIAAYLVANVALFARAYRPPMRWWQGILVWIGGFVAGTGFGTFLESPFRLMEEFPLAILGVFALSLGLGVALIWLGFWRRLGRDRGKINA